MPRETSSVPGPGALLRHAPGIVRVLVLTLTAGLLAGTAATQSMWVDEVATVWMSDAAQLGAVFRDAQLPLTYVLVGLARLLFGETEFVYRLVPMLFAWGLVAYLPRVFRAGGSSPLASELAPLLLVLHPQFLYFGQEVRAYMPMVTLLILWGHLRDTPGWRGWALCTLALFTNSFAIIYVTVIVGLDWALHRWRDAPRPARAPTIALAMHLPWIAFVIWQVGSSRFVFLQEADASPFAPGRLFNLEFAAYVRAAWPVLFPSRPLVWALLTLAGVVTLIRTGGRAAAFWLGIGIGVVLHAQLIRYSGWPAYERYLLMLVPFAAIPPLLRPWPRLPPLAPPVLAIGLAHLGYAAPSPRTGLLARVVPATHASLARSRRHNWSALTSVLRDQVTRGDTIGITCKGYCNPVSIRFYGRTDPVLSTIPIAEGCDADWIVAENPPPSPAATCGRAKVADFDSLALYGPADPNRELQPLHFGGSPIDPVRSAGPAPRVDPWD